MSGVTPGSGKPKVENRAQKEVTQLEQTQYRQQFREARLSEHKSWVDNNVYDIADMRKKHPHKLSKGLWALTVQRDKD